MIQMKSARTVFLPLLATALFFAPYPRAAFAQQGSPHTSNDPRGGVRSSQNTLNDPGGGVRSGNGQPLQITVLLAGKPWAKAAVAIAKSDGTVVVKGFTGADGTFTTFSALDADDYTITATTVHWAGSSNLTLKKSTAKAHVKIKMTKKPAGN